MTAVLETLAAQARAEGAELVTLRALIEEASEAGARRALHSVGLMDEDSAKDIMELRQLVQGWRDAKRTALASIVTWTVRTLVALLLIGLAYRAGLLRH